MEFQTCLVIIPTYNERENVASLIPDILHLAVSPDVLAVDDNSPDGTGEVLDRLSSEYRGKVSVIHRKAKQGIGSAYIRGFQYALSKGYQAILTMDADFSHSPEAIPEMLKRIGDADIIIGSRYIKGGRTLHWGFLRKINSRTANVLAKKMLGFRCEDCTAGFRLYRSSILQSLDLTKIFSNGYSFLIEVLLLCRENGARISEIPIVFANRRSGASKISREEIFKAILTLLKLWKARLRKESIKRKGR